MSTQPTDTEATPTASELLAVAARTLGERGADYDPNKAAGERSMLAVVQIFKELAGKEITEQEGWLFMVALKLARIKTSPAKRDSHVDLIAYVSLYSESVLAAAIGQTEGMRAIEERDALKRANEMLKKISSPE